MVVHAYNLTIEKQKHTGSWGSLARQTSQPNELWSQRETLFPKHKLGKD